MKVDLTKFALPKKPKGKPRGNPAKLKPFKKGYDPRRSGRKGHVQMSTRLIDELDKPAPPEVRKKFGLKPSATKYDCCLASMVHAAMVGDWQAALSIRDVIEGKLPNKNYNLSVEMQAYMDNPGFREWLAGQHESYLVAFGQGGEIVNDRPSSAAAAVARRLRGATVEAGAPEDCGHTG